MKSVGWGGRWRSYGSEGVECRSSCWGCWWHGVAGWEERGLRRLSNCGKCFY